MVENEIVERELSSSEELLERKQRTLEAAASVKEKCVWHERNGRRY